MNLLRIKRERTKGGRYYNRAKTYGKKNWKKTEVLI